MTNPPSTSNGDALDAIRAGALQMLGIAPVPGSALHLAPFKVPESAIHDFAQYAFLRDPNAFLGSVPSGPTIGTVYQFLQEAHQIISDIIHAHASMVETGTYRIFNVAPHFAEIIAATYQLFLANLASPLYEFAARVRPPYDYNGSSGSAREDVLSVFAAWFDSLVLTASWNPNSLVASFDNSALWVGKATTIENGFMSTFPGAQIANYAGEPEPSYTFTPFPTEFVNFGLRLVFRQEWRPLGTQSGEIVRTIPLGPKQTERVSTKVVVTQREARTSETFVSTETSTEASNVTRESSDVVEEASSSLKWHVDAEASGSMGFFSAKVSAGVAGETANSSKDSKSRLNETMQKTASKMRRDMKVVVSTERSITEETVHASEITNPNDEIAITYVYSKLQRQYEIQTTLAEVASVVLVPETVPKYNEITVDWIRAHDWILARVMLDPTFAADVAELAREPDEPPVDDPGGFIGTAASNAAKAISDYKSFTGGGAMPDLFSGVHDGYHRHLERKRGVDLNIQRRQLRFGRLIRHIQANILYYMRAIWGAEDADQRLRRYSTITVPTVWHFVPSGTPDPSQPDLEVAGEFLPDTGPTSMRPLTDVINPAGPVGYTGNYAVYYLRGDPALLDLNGALTLLRAQYVRFVVDVQGSGQTVIQAVAVMPRYRKATYAVTRTGAGAWTVTHQATNTQPAATSSNNDTTLQFDGLLVSFDAAPVVGQAFTVDLLATDELEDPELRSLALTNPLPPPANEVGFYSVDLLQDLATYLPDVAALLPADVSGGWATLSQQAQDAVRREYHLYLLLKEHTRRFLLETNNLIVDLDVGQTPALEEFKRLHRVVDVLKELEDAARRQLENTRRSERLSGGDFADPDVEQVTVIGGADELRTMVGPVITTGAGSNPSG